MPWFRVDDGFHSHPKVLATSPAALGLWVVAGSWSSAHLTDGVVPDDVLPRLLPDAAMLAEELVTNGLWKRRRGCHVFHEFLSKNPSKEAVENERKQAAERQRRRRERMTSRRDTGVTHGVSPPAPTRSSYGTSPPDRRAADNGRAAPPGGKPSRKPAWCGVCDQDTRLTGPPDQPYRCPECHPIDGRRTRQ